MTRDGENEMPSVAGDSPPEEDIEDILADYVSRLNAGEKIQPEEILVDHPISGPEILEQLEAFVGRTAARSSLEPGKLGSLGDYTLQRQIGRGGMGVVYEAWQRSMDRRVALKVLPAGLLADPRAVARFRREAKLAGRLHHPNVVSVYGLGVEEGSPCFAMELVDGETLEQILRRSRPSDSRERRRRRSEVAPASCQTPTEPALPSGAAAREAEEALPVESSRGNGFRPREIDLKYCLRLAESFAGAADGLQHAHAQSIIHRDLKPSNLILDKQGRLRILDFGLARLEGQESLTGSGEFLGTPRYMSPEQAKALSVLIDHRTDIYSLGATLYEMLSWRPPFEGKDYQDTISQIIHRDPQPLHRLNPRIPKDLETIVAKCLRKEPGERYGTAEALGQDLRRFVRGDPIEARPQPAWERLARRAWRYKGRIATGALVLALVFTLGGVILENSRQDRLRRMGEYGPRVLGAVMKMQQGRLRLKAEPAERSGALSEDTIFGFDFQTLVESSGQDPVEEAIRELEEAEELLPGRPDARFHRARGLLILGRNEQALEDLAMALDCDPGFVPARILRAAILERHGDRAGARAEMDRAASSSAKDWAEIWVSAHLAVSERRWKDAAAAYGQIIEKEAAGREPYLGSSAETRLGRGVARLEAEDFSGAIEDFVAARTLWPDALEPGLLLGKVYLLQKNDVQAEETFQGLLARARIHDEVATAIAALYSSLKDHKMGLAWAEKVRDVSLRERLRSALLFSLGRTDEAREAGRRAVEANPHDAQAYLVLAQADHAGGTQVNELMKAAIEADPRNTVARVWLAFDLSSEGKEKEARDLLEGGIRLEPMSPFGHHAMAKLYEQTGEFVEAFSSYTRAIDVAPDAVGPQAADCAIRLLARTDKPKLPVQELVRVLEKALASNPEKPALLLRSLALAKVYSSDRRDAVHALDCARLAVEKTDRQDPDSLAALAEVHFARGDLVEAVRTLEEAVRLPDAGGLLLSQLETYRRALLPRIASYASIDAALLVPEMETLIPEGASWRFFRGREEPSPALEWTTEGFDDSAWESGASGFGYGDSDDATVLDDMRGAYTSVYVRNVFTIADPSRYRRLWLSVRADDGFVAYLNGIEVGRARAGKGSDPVPFNGEATFAIENAAPTELWLERDAVRAGENCLAIQGLNSSLRSSDLTLMPILAGEVPSAEGRDRRLLERLRAQGQDEPAGNLLHYLEARLLERAGEHREARAKLSELVALDGARPEPLLRLAESLVAAGEPAAAEVRLRKALATGSIEDREAWDRWLELSFVDLKRSAASVLLGFEPEGTGAAPGRTTYGDDVLWLLQRLQSGEVIRIRCGGGEYTDRTGAVWGRDRFYLAGHPSQAERSRAGASTWKVHLASSLVTDRGPLPEDIAGTDDDPLYLHERCFTLEGIHPPAYRVPLPPGEYRVTLHFAEVMYRKEGMRRFDVLLEGKRVLEDHDLMTVGFAVAEKRTFRTSVSDGFLDIELGFVHREPKVSAFEIERVQ